MNNESNNKSNDKMKGWDTKTEKVGALPGDVRIILGDESNMDEQIKQAIKNYAISYGLCPHCDKPLYGCKCACGYTECGG